MDAKNFNFLKSPRALLGELYKKLELKMLNIRELRVYFNKQIRTHPTSLLIWGITFIGLLLRLALRYEAIHNYLDAYVYANCAKYLLLGKGFVFKSNGLFYIPWLNPWYSLFITPFYLLFGVSDQSVILCTVLFGVATIPLVYLLGRLLFGEWIGFLSLHAFSNASAPHGYQSTGLSAC